VEYKPPTRTRHELVADREQMPGCGLGIYVLVLFGMFVLGATGVIIASANMFYTNNALSPSNLSYGGEVSPEMLGPMRSMKLLGADEIPGMFHAENFLGTEACALTTESLLRLGPEGARKVAMADVGAVTLEGTDVHIAVHGADPVVCHFGEGEGGDKFARVLQAGPNGTPEATLPKQ